ncbi:GNAT family N-acetyltransferase [Halorubrum laminariae]|uniref:GNAT family N-acetyltransferase n=1 Tax=Halorubrum laminariae TaxID=1433523 RepID=A0ABD6BX95_9EURY|nr:N-acetyltransferase [Halorubrum laminariae]
MTGRSDDAGTKDDRPARVRTARPDDADRIRELQSHLRQPSPDLLEYGLAVESVQVSVADGDAASDVASDTPPTGDVVGYLLPVDAPSRPGVHIAELVVAPARRREGRASELLRAGIRDASGPVTLQAHPGNEAALALYDGLGFSVVDRRPDTYDDGDALVLRLD